MTEERRIEKFGVGNLYPDSNPPEFSFFKRTACNVELDDDGFTFTPRFNDFKEYDDLFEYLKDYISDKKLEKLYVQIDWLRTCIYQIDPDTLQLGEIIFEEGNFVENYRWNPDTQEFDEDDEDDEDEDVDWEV